MLVLGVDYSADFMLNSSTNSISVKPKTPARNEASVWLSACFNSSLITLINKAPEKNDQSKDNVT